MCRRLNFIWHTEAWKKWLIVCRWYFQMAFLQLFFFVFCFFVFWFLTEICCWGLNWHCVSTGLGNGLVLNRHQAISWTPDDQILWHHVASLDHNQLRTNLQCESFVIKKSQQNNNHNQSTRPTPSGKWITVSNKSWHIFSLQGTNVTNNSVVELMLNYILYFSLH